MKLQYLGTGAFEGIPALFCECDVCKQARENGGKNIRTRSQAIVDDRLLIDFPADTFMHFLRENLPMTKIEHCLITHSHSDHLYPNDMIARLPGYSHIPDIKPMTFYADEHACGMMRRHFAKNGAAEAFLRCENLALYTPTDIGGYTVTALRAKHDPTTTPVIFIIEKEGKRMLYGNDTGTFTTEAREYLSTLGGHFDLVSLDCTGVWTDINYESHMNVKRCAEMRQLLLDLGLADGCTKFILNHFSHNGEGIGDHDALLASVAPLGFDVSYDGMTVQF